MSQSQRTEPQNREQRKAQSIINDISGSQITGSSTRTNITSSSNRFKLGRSPVGTPVAQSLNILAANPDIRSIPQMEVGSFGLRQDTITIEGDVELAVQNIGALPLRSASQVDTSVTFVVNDEEYEAVSGISETIGNIPRRGVGSAIHGWEITFDSGPGLDFATQAKNGNLTTRVDMTVNARLYSETFSVENEIEAENQ